MTDSRHGDFEIMAEGFSNLEFVGTTSLNIIQKNVHEPQPESSFGRCFEQKQVLDFLRSGIAKVEAGQTTLF